MKELDRIKKILKEKNIKNKKSKYGLWIYTAYTTFFIDNKDLNLERTDSKNNNDIVLSLILEKEV